VKDSRSAPPDSGGAWSSLAGATWASAWQFRLRYGSLLSAACRMPIAGLEPVAVRAPVSRKQPSMGSRTVPGRRLVLYGCLKSSKITAAVAAVTMIGNIPCSTWVALAPEPSHRPASKGPAAEPRRLEATAAPIPVPRVSTR
jgi:hypothetical protein